MLNRWHKTRPLERLEIANWEELVQNHGSLRLEVDSGGQNSYKIKKPYENKK